MRTTEQIEIYATFLEHSFSTDSKMEPHVVSHLVELYKSGAHRNPLLAFEQILEQYGNCDVSQAVVDAQALMEHPELYKKLCKLNSETKIETNPAVIARNHASEINLLQRKMSISIQGKDIDTNEILKKSEVRVPSIFQESKASQSNAVKRKGLDLDIRYSNPESRR